MTRFARAKGSKASNKREVESATSWEEMRPNSTKKKRERSGTILENATESTDEKLTPQPKKVKTTTEQKINEKPTLAAIDSKPEKPITPKQKKNDKEYSRRKPFNETTKIYINGVEVEIDYFDGFPVKKADCDRLRQLRKDMISKGIPRSEVKQALKLERRKAEKALAREKKKLCFNCRKGGHVLSECPMLKSGPDAQLSETGICFKCGSTEHTHFQCKVTRGDHFKFAQCFICKEQGHIARQCPDNSKGLYPNGGACRVCGDVTHLKKDCPLFQSEQEDIKVVAHTINDNDVEGLEQSESPQTVKPNKLRNKVVKF